LGISTKIGIGTPLRYTTLLNGELKLTAIGLYRRVSKM